MTKASKVFEVEREEQTLILTPTKNLGELANGQIDAEEKAILHLLADVPAKNLVLDFHKTDYFGSSALGFFVRLWKLVRGRGGCLAICHLSDHEREILTVCGFDSLWPIHPSREEALEAVRGEKRPCALTSRVLQKV
jgi:stage II sporulation protein AA (anti-sigma F factor antagonist)